jgi:heme A synthase
VQFGIALDAGARGPVRDFLVTGSPCASVLNLDDWRSSLRINSLAAFAGFGALALGRSQDTPAYTHVFLQCGATAMLIGGLWLAFAGHKPRPRRNAQSLLLNAMPAFVFIALGASTILTPAPSPLLVVCGYAAAATLGFQVAARWRS